jgi:hypothetical protein
MYYCIILMKVENTTCALMLQGPFRWPFASTHTHLFSNAFDEEYTQPDLES